MTKIQLEIIWGLYNLYKDNKINFQSFLGKIRFFKRQSDYQLKYEKPLNIGMGNIEYVSIYNIYSLKWDFSLKTIKELYSLYLYITKCKNNTQIVKTFMDLVCVPNLQYDNYELSKIVNYINNFKSHIIELQIEILKTVRPLFNKYNKK